VDRVDVLVIGAGVVGLAVAQRLARPGREIVVAEANPSFGRETSSRNSEVIHCGMYYAEDLLKTTLCVRGNPLLYELCVKAGIPYRKTGKIMVATDREEEAAVRRVLDQGRRNGVPGMRLLSPAEIREMEPHVSATLGLYSPESGILDTHALMAWLEREAASRGVTFAYGCRVLGLAAAEGGIAAEIRDADGGALDLWAPVVVNCAGLGSDALARSAGIDIDAAGYRIRPAKGEYFRVSYRHKGKLSHLVYPVPSEVHLGAHAVLGLDGSLRLGPNSVNVDSLDYTVDPSHRGEFHEKAARFLPFLEPEDLTPDMAGIRPKLYRLGEPFRDFVIREEGDRGLPGLVNLIGIESPGLTSCLSIAEMVEEITRGRA
jgi:L-2-hydroxyglutarate oxidase LhgO